MSALRGGPSAAQRSSPCARAFQRAGARAPPATRSPQPRAAFVSLHQCGGRSARGCVVAYGLFRRGEQKGEMTVAITGALLRSAAAARELRPWQKAAPSTNSCARADHMRMPSRSRNADGRGRWPTKALHAARRACTQLLPCDSCANRDASDAALQPLRVPLSHMPFRYMCICRISAQSGGCAHTAKLLVSGMQHLRCARMRGFIIKLVPTSCACAGATGLVGSRLVAKLTSQGNTVKALTRDVGRAQGKLPYSNVEFVASDDWESALAGCDGVVNLAGEPIATRCACTRTGRASSRRPASFTKSGRCSDGGAAATLRFAVIVRPITVCYRWC